MMTLADTEAARNLEREAFADQLTPTAFETELTKNPVARYVAVDNGDGALAGFGGLWIQLDEAHIVNVVVRPGLRRRGYGRLIVHALVDLATRYGMTSATLEVRPDNVAARALYHVYGFYEVGERRRYYSDGGDALIMTTEDLQSAAYRQRFEALEGELRARFRLEAAVVDPASVPDLRG
jgi:ribosomal-protein-alanine N-acetyltransferase